MPIPWTASQLIGPEGCTPDCSRGDKVTPVGSNANQLQQHHWTGKFLHLKSTFKSTVGTEL